jgi:hypothetical protein
MSHKKRNLKNKKKSSQSRLRIDYKRIVLGILIVYLLFVIFPRIQFDPVRTGLDPSWVWGANYLAQSDFIFGFTYGPLGYLLMTQDIGPNLVHAIIFWYAIYVIFSAVLIYLFLKQKNLLALGVFIVAFVLFWAIMYGQIGVSWSNPDLQNLFVLLVGILLGISFTESKKIFYISALAAGLLAGICLFIKVNLALSTLSMLIIFSLILILRQRKQAWRPVLATWGAYVLPALVLLIIHFKSIGNLALWLKAYIVIAVSNSATMSYGTVQLPLVIIGSLELAFYIGLTLLLIKRKSLLGYISVIYLISVFFAFKESFYRQDPGHLIYYFLFVPLVLLACFLFAKDKKELLGISGVFLVAIILTLSFPAVVKPAQAISNNFSGMRSMITGKVGWSNLVSLTQIEDIRKKARDQSQINLEKDRLPPEWISIMGNSTVDVVPWEISYIPANGLRWEPNPLLQTFVSSSPFLDNWSANHFTGDTAPQYVIADFTNVDGRHPLMDAALTWRNIQRNYELIKYDEQANRLLLKRKLNEPVENMVSLGHDDARLNQWVEVPSSDNLVYGKIDLHTSIVGRITGFAYIVPPVNMDVIFSSGKVSSWKIIPSTLANGIMLNYVPSNSKEWSQLYSGVASDRVEWFRISGPGAKYQSNNVKIDWMEAPYPIEYKGISVPNVAKIGEDTLFNIEGFDNQAPGQNNYSFAISLQKTEMVTISGWAVDQKAETAAGGVFLNIDGEKDIPASYGIDRPDVADYFQNINYGPSGFSVSFPTSWLDKGKHVLTLKIVTADKREYYEPAQKITLEIKP